MDKAYTRIFLSVIIFLIMFLTGVLQAATDVTFFVGSDPHYRTIKEDKARYPRNEAIVDDMNALPGNIYPEEVGGGAIAVPRGVLIPGDLIHSGNWKTTSDQWSLFTSHFGVKRGEGRCQYPAYEAWGNHDGPPENYTNWTTTCHLQENIKIRTTRRTGLTAVSENGKFYSWDWDGVHFVSLGIYPGNEYINPTEDPVWHSPQHSLDFLIKDLKENVGTSGRPVITMHHYDVNESTRWWTERDHLNYARALKPYNVVLVIYGHTGVGAGIWNEPEAGTSISYLGAGWFGTGYFVVHITDGKLVIVQRLPKGTWGDIRQTSIIKMR